MLLRFGIIVDLLTEELYAALIRMVHARNEAQKGRFARTVDTDKSEHSARQYIAAEVINCP